MKLWLSRQANGMYMLTERKPIAAPVDRLDYTDLYIAPGDAIGIRNVCGLILGVCGVPALKRGESVQVELEGRPA